MLNQHTLTMFTNQISGCLQILRDEAELKRKQDIHEIEERKNAHIQELMKKHEKVGQQAANTSSDWVIGKTLKF